MTEKALALRSLIKADGELVVSLEDIEIPRPAANEVVVRIEAAPINPSDLGMVFAAADLETAKVSGTKDRPVLTATIPERARKAFAGRVDEPMPVGNEGAGTVVAGPEHLVGKKVAFYGGGSYAQYRAIPVENTLVLDEGTTAAQGASAFINPLTVLGMLETRKREGHTAIVHTAAGSALGQMLHRACAADGVPLVNVVRKEEQVALLRGLGAKHVVNTSAPSFSEDLAAAVEATGATLAFDAVGGGKLADQILVAMEKALAKKSTMYNRYGTSTLKQVYVYGGLDVGPTEISRAAGLGWSVGGWLVFWYLAKLDAATNAAIRQRVARELTTTFVTEYAREISLTEMLSLDAIHAYAKRATGGKFLVRPNAT